MAGSPSSSPVLSSAIVSIDGETKEPVVDRVDFVTVGPKGVFPRTSPVREEVAEDLLGVTIAYVTPRTLQEVALPMDQTPSKEKARRILTSVLPNVCRAFESREEFAAYDRLAVSVTGETLTDIDLVLVEGTWKIRTVEVLEENA